MEKTNQFILEKIEKLFSTTDLTEEHKKNIQKELLSIVSKLCETSEVEILQAKLKILFEYEKHYLDLIKEYKEEIKFVTAIQADLRKERSQFFAQVLGEVNNTFRKAEVEKDVAAGWIKELVSSYTNSLDVCSDLAMTKAIENQAEIRIETQTEIKKAKNKSDINEKN